MIRAIQNAELIAGKWLSVCPNYDPMLSESMHFVELDDYSHTIKVVVEFHEPGVAPSLVTVHLKKPGDPQGVVLDSDTPVPPAWSGKKAKP